MVTLTCDGDLRGHLGRALAGDHLFEQLSLGTKAKKRKVGDRSDDKAAAKKD